MKNKPTNCPCDPATNSPLCFVSVQKQTQGDLISANQLSKENGELIHINRFFTICQNLYDQLKCSNVNVLIEELQDVQNKVNTQLNDTLANITQQINDIKMAFDRVSSNKINTLKQEANYQPLQYLSQWQKIQKNHNADEFRDGVKILSQIVFDQSILKNIISQRSTLLFDCLKSQVKISEFCTESQSQLQKLKYQILKAVKDSQEHQRMVDELMKNFNKVKRSESQQVQVLFDIMNQKPMQEFLAEQQKIFEKPREELTNYQTKQGRSQSMQVEFTSVLQKTKKFFFSPTMHHQGINLQFNQASTNTDLKFNKIALVEPPINQPIQQDMRWIFKISNIKQIAESTSLSIGISIKSYAENNQFNFQENNQKKSIKTNPDNSNQYHSTSSNANSFIFLNGFGVLQNSFCEGQKYVKTDFRLNKGDRIIVDYLPFRQELIFTKEQTGRKLIAQIKNIGNVSLFPAVILGYQEDCVCIE